MNHEVAPELSESDHPRYTTALFFERVSRRLFAKPTHIDLAPQTFEALLSTEESAAGFGFDPFLAATGYWDDEDIAPLGVPFFEPGAFFVVGDFDENPGLPFPLQNYSRRELCGWLHYAITRNKSDRKRAKQLLEYASEYFDIDDVNGLVEQKLSGGVPWDCKFPELTSDGVPRTGGT